MAVASKVTVMAGNDIEGLQIDEELLTEALGDLNDSQTVNILIDRLRKMLLIELIFSGGVTSEQALTMLNQHVHDVH